MKAERKKKAKAAPAPQEPKPRKKPVRHRFAVLRNVDVLGSLYTLSMTQAGVVVHRCNGRKAKDAVRSLEQLVLDSGAKCQVDGERYEVRVHADGVAVCRAGCGAKPVRLGWTQLANLCRPQPVLFPEAEREAPGEEQPELLQTEAQIVDR